MARLTPIAESDLTEEVKALIDAGSDMMGFTPNDALIMALKPELTKAVSALVLAIYGPSLLSSGLKRLIGYINSTASGCVYCQVHTAHGALKEGVEAAKIRAAWEYETSALFTEAERAALRVAQAAGQTPNQVSDAEFDALKAYYSDEEIVEIVSVIAMFGFLNRWNSTLATELEKTPLSYAKKIGVFDDA